EELRDQKGHALVLTHVIDRQNVGMIQGRYGSRFLFKPVQAIRIASKGFGKNLDCDFTAKPRITSAVDFAHSPRAERRLDLVGTEPDARGEGHLCTTL